MWTLIKDPIASFDPDSVGLSPVGVKLVNIDGTWHVFDWVGAKHYPNAADFLEEAVRFGLSRRISKKEDFSLLSAESRLILVHPKAIVTGEVEGVPPCPTERHPVHSDRMDIQEAGRLWVVGDPNTVSEDSLLYEETPIWATHKVAEDEFDFRVRTMPGFEYNLAPRPDGVTLSPGIIMVAPIERISVVNDPDDAESIGETLKNVHRAALPVTLDEE